MHNVGFVCLDYSQLFWYSTMSKEIYYLNVVINMRQHQYVIRFDTTIKILRYFLIYRTVYVH